MTTADTITQISEVLYRSQQGRTQPYVCRGDDGLVYFAKGRSANRRGLACEWICAHLAQHLGLPIAPFKLLEVSSDLMAASQSGSLNLRDLGVGPVFGSQRAIGVELSPTQVLLVSAHVQQSVAVLDWWIRNGDRTLTVHGGNANLLWDASGQGTLVVIDHNLAFDREFSTSAFSDLHVFSGAFKEVCSDMFLRQLWQDRLVAALNQWQIICDTMPAGWLFADDEQTIPADIDLDNMLATLQRCQLDTFWNTAP